MKHILVLIVFILVLTGLTGLSDARAQTGDGYEMVRYTISAGGGTSAGSGYTLVGTAGQPDAGAAMTGGGFTLVGGFWGGGASQHKVYLPLVLR